ncbi:unnamed protein product [Cochlearia groenlandica]
MHCFRSLLLQHLNLRVSVRPVLVIGRLSFTTTTGEGGQDQVLSKVIELVKKYDKANASKVTESADFQKDLSMDSLDKVELVMAIEEEFSIEISDDKADKLTCCGDIATYIVSETRSKSSES